MIIWNSPRANSGDNRLLLVMIDKILGNERVSEACGPGYLTAATTGGGLPVTARPGAVEVAVKGRPAITAGSAGNSATPCSVHQAVHSRQSKQ
jgi:hypothetical protein